MLRFHSVVRGLLLAVVLAAFPAGTPVAAQDLVVRGALVTLVDDAQLSATEAGPLTSVGVQVGSPVKPGQLLARIDDSKADLALKRAHADVGIAAEKAKNDTSVKFAKKAKAVALAELRRAEIANRRFPNSISQSELDALRLSVEKADAQTEQAQVDQKIAGLSTKLKEADRDLAEADVKNRRIVSPIGGRIVEVNRQTGEWVKPGDKVFRIISLDRLRAKGFVKFASIRGKLEGRTVVLTVNLPGDPSSRFLGKVTFVSDEVDPNTGEVAVWAEIKNPNHRLKPGLRGTMTIRGN
jgi:multidrug resistance efflux pump